MQNLGEAFASVLAFKDDRKVLAYLLQAGRETRYEVLRRAVEEQSPQMFKYCIDRLGRNGLINRRLVPRGRRFDSYISETETGEVIARVLIGLAVKGTVPRGIPASSRIAIQSAFLEPASALAR